jgi:DNA-binding response OmpR family regulator
MPGIALIEDDALMRALVVEWLTAEGYGVIDASQEGSTPTCGRVDAVIVDVYMPRVLGLERLRAARSAYPGVPIIAISAQFRAGMCCEGPAARSLGVDRVVAKPFERHALLRAVRSVMLPQAAAACQGA